MLSLAWVVLSRLPARASLLRANKTRQARSRTALLCPCSRIEHSSHGRTRARTGTVGVLASSAKRSRSREGQALHRTFATWSSCWRQPIRSRRANQARRSFDTLLAISASVCASAPVRTHARLGAWPKHRRRSPCWGWRRRWRWRASRSRERRTARPPPTASFTGPPPLGRSDAGPPPPLAGDGDET